MVVSILRAINIGNLLLEIHIEMKAAVCRTNKQMVVKISRFNNLHPNKLYIGLLRENYIFNLEKLNFHLSSSGKSVRSGQ